jgi:ABC-type methionine transport system permease subunit
MIDISAVAGTVWDAGLAALAIRYGKERLRIDVLAGTIVIRTFYPDHPERP